MYVCNIRIKYTVPSNSNHIITMLLPVRRLKVADGYGREQLTGLVWTGAVPAGVSGGGGEAGTGVTRTGS